MESGMRDIANMVRKPINVQSLKDIAVYLSGVRDGKGNLLPLGTIVIDDLWEAVQYLQGDVRFTSEIEKQIKKIEP